MTHIGDGRTNNTREYIVCGIFAALIAVGAYIRIPIPVCPFTLQFLFTALAGVILGGRKGALAVGVYVLLGLIGVPVFTEGGGPSYVFQPTFGYLLGYILGTYVGGQIARAGLPTFTRFFMADLANLAIVYACGIIYLWGVYAFYLGQPKGISYMSWYCLVFAIPGDVLLSCLAAVLGLKLYRQLSVLGK